MCGAACGDWGRLVVREFDVLCCVFIAPKSEPNAEWTTVNCEFGWFEGLDRHFGGSLLAEGDYPLTMTDRAQCRLALKGRNPKVREIRAIVSGGG